MDVILAALDALGADSKTAPRTAPAPPPQPSRPAPPPSRLPQQSAVAPADPPRAPARPAGLLQGLFEDGNSLLRAVIAAEVLQPPLALREPPLWIQQPNEPST